MAAAVDSSVTSVPGLSDAAAWITPDEARLVGVLLAAGQAHAFAGWTPGAHEDKKHAFFEQVRAASAAPRGGGGERGRGARRGRRREDAAGACPRSAGALPRGGARRRTLCAGRRRAGSRRAPARLCPAHECASARWPARSRAPAPRPSPRPAPHPPRAVRSAGPRASLRRCARWSTTTPAA